MEIINNIISFCKYWFCFFYRWFNKISEFLIPVSDLVVRLVIAYNFLPSGWLKYKSWSTTLMLFQHEYSVPLLSPTLAAYIGTFIEIVFPILLVLGLGMRIPAFVMFVFNLVAVYAYRAFLFSDAGALGLEEHFYWGVLLFVTLCRGHGKLSLDYLLCRYCRHGQ